MKPINPEKPINPVNPDCMLCKHSTQHKCTKCGKLVCNLLCSIQDPNSSNETQRQHKEGDQRYIKIVPKIKQNWASLQIDENGVIEDDF